MTREEALEEAIRCAKAAVAAVRGMSGSDASEAWSAAGQLWTEIALMTPAEPRSPVAYPTEL